MLRPLGPAPRGLNCEVVRSVGKYTTCTGACKPEVDGGNLHYAATEQMGTVH